MFQSGFRPIDQCSIYIFIVSIKCSTLALSSTTPSSNMNQCKVDMLWSTTSNVNGGNDVFCKVAKPCALCVREAFEELESFQKTSHKSTSKNIKRKAHFQQPRKMTTPTL